MVYYESEREEEITLTSQLLNRLLPRDTIWKYGQYHHPLPLHIFTSGLPSYYCLSSQPSLSPILNHSLLS